MPGNGNHRISQQWSALENLARKYLVHSTQLTILRPVAVVPSPTLFSRRLSSTFVPTLPGHDPAMQFLSLNDLAEAIVCALKHDKPGTFNIAPHSVVPL